MQKKPDLPIWQLINMSIGFFGIQHGFEIQFARMSSIYEKLGAKPDELPFLWLAAPLTGLIIQPIIGYMSDKTWIPGLKMRRRPYFFTGAILATIALFFMPNSSSIWMAAGCLWILDASLNISMEPFRAFVGDKLNKKQRPAGYAYQGLMIGLGTIFGTWIASLDWMKFIPHIISKNYSFSPLLSLLYVFFSSTNTTSTHLAFYICAIIYLCAVIYTVFATTEYPPEESEEKDKKEKSTFIGALNKWFKETLACYLQMPPVMKRLAIIQFFTWMGLFCLWIFYNVAVAHYVFGATDPHSELYDEGIRWGTHTMIIKGVVTPIFSLFIPLLVRYMGKAYTHTTALLLCGIGLLAVPFIHDKNLLYIPMIAAGIGWGSIVALPYVILVDHIPPKQYGIFMGIFNMFIVIPEIMVSLGIGKILMKLVNNNHAYAVAFGGILIIIAALITPTLNQFEKDKTQKDEE
ncbi:MAG TPA: MFS transporter [Candidatus Eremiobacteraeota bacterium]|nr:MAG: Major Facilitator Superfamily protein [bacterium ADurb.Bin363]HPZ09803.1 MFS transporter [Candidatus Eremiobacteraeota bacterium]